MHVYLVWFVPCSIPESDETHLKTNLRLGWDVGNIPVWVNVVNHGKCQEIWLCTLTTFFLFLFSLSTINGGFNWFNVPNYHFYHLFLSIYETCTVFPPSHVYPTHSPIRIRGSNSGSNLSHWNRIWYISITLDFRVRDSKFRFSSVELSTPICYTRSLVSGFRFRFDTVISSLFAFKYVNYNNNLLKMGAYSGQLPPEVLVGHGFQV